MTTQATPLLHGISQFEVDFVIPRLGVDIPLGIDPFLLFKSRDEDFALLHTKLLSVFNHAIDALRAGNEHDARYLLDFPEPSELGFGYTRKGKQGAGVGVYLSQLIIETLFDSPLLLERGVRHIEEMQLVSVGIGPDRISDITANLIKDYLITYTQRQCQLWKLPLVSGVPVRHIFDFDSLTWRDEYVDLPVSPYDSTPIILVPRRIVRSLPWINYDDYFRKEFAAYLRKERVHKKLATAPSSQSINKEYVVSVSRRDIERIDRYINEKEKTASQATPSISYLDETQSCPEAEKLSHALTSLPIGIESAQEYQRLVLEILNYLFSPDLIDGEFEVKTVDGTERRDIIFTNDSDGSFWSFIRQEHSSILLMFETKNTQGLEISHINQVASYLGFRLGHLGFIVTRNPPDVSRKRKLFSVFNDSHPKKIILVLCDKDLLSMIELKCKGENPMKYAQRLYREFRQTVQ